MNALSALTPKCCRCGADLSSLVENSPYGLCNSCFVKRLAVDEAKEGRAWNVDKMSMADLKECYTICAKFIHHPFEPGDIQLADAHQLADEIALLLHEIAISQKFNPDDAFRLAVKLLLKEGYIKTQPI